MKRLIAAIGTISTAFFLTYLGIGLIDHPPTQSQDYAAWVQAFGSIAAILAAIWVYHSQNDDAIKRAKDEEDASVQHVLRSLRDEISLAVANFAKKNDEFLLGGADGTPFLYIIPFGDRQFPIYEGSSDKIGMIQNDELRRQIIIGYGHAMGFIQSIRLNNALVEKFEHADYLAATMKDDVHLALRQRSLTVVSQYGDVLRSSYKEARQRIDEMLEELHQNIKSD